MRDDVALLFEELLQVHDEKASTIKQIIAKDALIRDSVGRHNERELLLSFQEMEVLLDAIDLLDFQTGEKYDTLTQLLSIDRNGLDRFIEERDEDVVKRLKIRQGEVRELLSQMLSQRESLMESLMNEAASLEQSADELARLSRVKKELS